MTVTALLCRIIISVLFVFVGSSLLDNRNGLGVTITGVESFAPPLQQGRRSKNDWEQQQQRSQRSTRHHNSVQDYSKAAAPSLSSSCLAMSSSSLRTDVSVPSQAECESLGVREWPQQSKKGSWTETVAPGKSLVRYVLEGTGSLKIVTGDGTKPISVKPGILVEVETGGDASSSAVELVWACDANCSEMILLTPGFEESGVFLGVVAGILVLFGVLLSGVLG
uniref:Uncharacterized protein n=1 Tax=Pseudo-nitzschia australis TaxID=44445 RepID=A0A7S4AEF7_9STRA|mmetsp:Transcript_26813/g.58818  ORF Transcript_26813/g.58818 Transcript_26813/m.58818 type:complete len:223 (+) Transcript_26813:140-808(+)